MNPWANVPQRQQGFPSRWPRRETFRTMTRLFAGTPWDQPPTCERCGALLAACSCGPEPAPIIPPHEQTARLAIEKRPKGKVVTVVRGLPAVGNDLPALLAALKQACAAGGALKDDSLELQGGHLERVRSKLATLGYKTLG